MSEIAPMGRAASTLTGLRGLLLLLAGLYAIIFPGLTLTSLVLLGGALFFGVIVESVKYNSGFIYGIKAFTAAVLGGIGNIRGAFLGGFALGLLESYGATLLGGEWRDVFSFTILVLVLMFRPTGILGEQLGRSRA